MKCSIKYYSQWLWKCLSLELPGCSRGANCVFLCLLMEVCCWRWRGMWWRHFHMISCELLWCSAGWQVACSCGMWCCFTGTPVEDPSPGLSPVWLTLSNHASSQSWDYVLVGFSLYLPSSRWLLTLFCRSWVGDLQGTHSSILASLALLTTMA